MGALVEAAWTDDDRQFMAGDHLPHEKLQITTRSDASGAVDGVKDSPFGFHTAQDEFAPWWQVDLGAVHDLDRVVVYNRMDNNDLAYRTREIQVWLKETPEQKLFRKVYQHDGTELRQLTDGNWNDFDPCVLPNGRIAFVAERRGGFLRCGRYCPTFTLFSMEPDGGDHLRDECI